MGVAAFSHFVLDWPMHLPDLALWPGSATHLDFGLWQGLPTGWWFVELAFVLAAGAYYVAKARRSESFGRRPVVVLVVVLILNLANSPWLSAL